MGTTHGVNPGHHLPCLNDRGTPPRGGGEMGTTHGVNPGHHLPCLNDRVLSSGRRRNGNYS
ncbi:MAG: hypothetical protein R2727_11750 [Bacteroidales bacterium]